MQNTTSSQLHDETAAWCVRAEQAAKCADFEPFACLALVRDGILLRRRWDLLDGEAPQRRRLLRLLAAVQNLCHQQLADSLTDQAEPEPERVEHVIRRLAEDDHYLAELLDDHTLPPESVAFAVECFRDDLYWLGTLVALLDGTRGIDFAGRVLLEQESLQQTLESREAAIPAAAPSSAVPDELRQSARQLRATALARQAEALLDQPEPQDVQGWYEAWQAASRLVMRLERAAAADLEKAVEDYRARTMAGWAECLAELPPDRRKQSLQQVAEDLADATGESLTFLEDMPLVEAVQGLEILADDTAMCLRAMERHGNSELGRLRRSLNHRKKALAAELQERRLAWRLERLFGHRAVAALERFILLLLVLFMVMLVIETPLVNYERQHRPGSNLVVAVCAWADLVICLVFLGEFSLKIGLARRRPLFLRRNFITMLLPSIPFGFIMYQLLSTVESVEAAETIVLLRLLRLPRMVRWLRIARPVIRAGRLLAFVMQASDRLVRQVAPLLNRNLVLFERAAIKVRQPPHRTMLAALRERFRYRASEVIAGLPQPARRRLLQARIEDLTAVLSAPRVGMVAPAGRTAVSTTREVPLEGVIARLLAATPAGISDRIGRTLALNVARWCRAFDVFGVRRLPVVRDLVTAGHRSSPYGTTAEVANRIGALLRQLLDRVYWVADLYGTLTAPQLVDSVGDWMVKGTARPARRLLMLGGAFLLVFFLAGLLPFDPLQELTDTFKRLVAAPLVILGVLCLLPLLVGLWFRQIAGEATDFCTQVAEAQFITATKQLKRRFAKRHHAILHSRVIAPELETAAALSRSSASSGEPSEGEKNVRSGPARAAVELLFDDYLDGAPFHRSDTKTTTQLLGNLTLVSLRETRLGYGRRQRKRLRRLDLANTRAWLRGPYLWFHFISRSLAQQTAKLVVDYNAHALPLDRAATADDQEVRCHVEWLSRRLKKPADQLLLAAEFRNRFNAFPSGGHVPCPAGGGVSHPRIPPTAHGRGETDGSADAKEDRRGRGFHGNDFTAIHFLSADPQLEADVRRRYGEEVAELMHRDRRDNIRRVFRTYPFHRWPKGQRTVNPLAIYARYLAGGRVLLLPLHMLCWAVILTARAARLLWTFVRDVLHPTVSDLDALEEPDPLAVAVRKIYRMRKPVFLECLRMRAEFDPEYLGVSLPGSAAYARRATTTPIEEDLALIDAGPGVRQKFRRLASKRHRQILEFRRLLAKLACQQKSSESLRAMAIAYSIDYRNVRSRLEATERLKRAFDEAPANHSGSSWSVRALWCRWRYAARVDRLFEQPAFGDSAGQRKACLGLLCRRRGPLLEALRQLTRRDAPADPVDDARRTLLAVARDPATWSRQLVVLRAVQTLSVLDLRTYCDLVAELGEYDTYPADDADGMAAST